MKRLRITVEGKVYEVVVEVLDESGASVALPAPMGLTAPATPTPAAAQEGGSGVVGSPLAGVVVSIQVQPGQQVAKGDQLLIISAMKMNTYVYAPADGRVDEILVKPGDTIEEGRALIRIG